MSQIIIHLDGAYNVYSTITDAPLFRSALTLEQLTQWIKDEYGNSGLRELPERLARAHATGSSAYNETLRECILGSRAGRLENALPFNKFVRRFLTLKIKRG